MKNLLSKNVFAVLLAMFAVVGVANAADLSEDGAEVGAAHHGHYDIHCSTRNARGQVFQAEGYSHHARDYREWRRIQADATYECTRTSAFCRELGCHEHYHHD